jgi:hypothetical protein
MLLFSTKAPDCVLKHKKLRCIERSRDFKGSAVPESLKTLTYIIHHLHFAITAIVNMAAT